jgi:hypothetical protein
MPSFPVAQFVQNVPNINQVPMLGELAVFHPPDVDGSEREGFSGRRDTSYGLGVSGRKCVARDDFVAGNDAVFDLKPDIRIEAKMRRKFSIWAGRPEGLRPEC